MSLKTKQMQVGDCTYCYNYRICDKCGKHHYEQGYITYEGKELCAKCELERIGTVPKNKIYIIDGDNDKIIKVIHKTGKENYTEIKNIIENMTDNKVWWAMNNVTGKFSADVYIVSKELN